jgi:DNA repair exonuclease SbcCD nuclease subunit
MKILVVGDPHVRFDDLEDCENLFNLVKETAVSFGAQKIVILGDLFHNHSIIHVSVLNFWRRWFLAFKSLRIEVIALKGNHDFGIHNPSEHSLEPFKDVATIVDTPQYIDGMLFLPYFGHRESKAFYGAASQQSKIMFCHESFDGAKYDNGFYAPDGFNQEMCNSEYIISGHIHTPSVLKGVSNTVYYIGAPRWQTLSDANVNRHIGVFNTETLEWDLVETKKVCKQILKTEITDISQLDDKYAKENSVETLVLYGTKEEVDKMVEKVQGRGFLIKTSIKHEEIKIRESDGISKAYVAFLNESFSKLLPKEEVEKYIERNSTWIAKI